MVPCFVFGQNNQQQIEDLAEALEQESVNDNALYEDLELLLKNPLNINTASKDALLKMPFLNELQVIAIIDYRKELGGISSILELQAIESLTIDVIQKIAPYVVFSKGIDDTQLPLLSQLKNANHEIYSRYETTLAEREGYIEDEDGNTRYSGAPFRWYTRYRSYYDNTFSFGITAEKDEGESLFRSDNNQGFDFYSAHLSVSRVNKQEKAL